MKTQNSNSVNPETQSCQMAVSGCTGHFLTEALDALVYKTPQKIIAYVEKNKHDYLIKNAPYEVRN